MCKPLTDYIPCEKITEDDYIEHILRQIGGLQKWPNANKMAELIETFEDVQKNMPDISCKALEQLIFTKKSQSPVSILASLVADQMNDYFEKIKEKNCAILTRTRLNLYAIKYAQQSPQSDADIKKHQSKKKSDFLLYVTNNYTPKAAPHDVLSMQISQLLQLDNQILEAMAQRVYGDTSESSFSSQSRDEGHTSSEISFYSDSD